MNPIVFLTSGTRGDVQPVTALARALQHAGHAVRVSAPPAFRELVESSAVPFSPLEGNPSDLLTDPGRQSALTFRASPLSALAYLRAARPVYAQMLENGWRTAQDASALVIGLPTIWGTSIAEKLNIPCIGAFLQPVTTTSEFPSPLIPSMLRAGKVYNRLTHRLMSLAIYWPWKRVIDLWRNHALRLPRLPWLYDHFKQMDLVLYGFSERVVQRPQDWDKSRVITGYWSRPAGEFSHTPLKQFIESGDSPVYFGFGSPGMHDPEALVHLLSAAIQQTNTRAVVSLPNHVEWPEKRGTIFVLRESISHEWLFPQMAGIVHHGGAGTTAEALKAGVPNFVTPLAVDQFFWGERIQRLGVGPKAVPQRVLTVEALIRALAEMKNETMKANARRLANELQAENGIEDAVTAFKKFLERRAG